MKYFTAGCFTLFVNLLYGSAIAMEEIDTLTDMSDPERCLTLRSIKKIKIVDQHNILFYVRGKKLYRNTLPRKCSGLRPDSVISYKVSMGRLCRMDIISVQDKFGDLFSPSSSCTLGNFEQIPTKEELIEED